MGDLGSYPAMNERPVFYTQTWYHSPGAMLHLCRSKASLKSVIINSLQGIIQRSHEGFRYFLIIYLFITFAIAVEHASGALSLI